MKRVLLIVLATGICLVAAGLNGRVTPAKAAGVLPTKVAVIVLENQDYAQTQVTNQTGGAQENNAPWINGAGGLESMGVSIVPNPSNCDYISGDTQGTGTTACTGAMFQSYRNDNGFLNGASAPEYGFLSMGADANIRDEKFPCGGLDPADDFTCNQNYIGANPNDGIVGYTPDSPCTQAADGHCTSGTGYNIFDYMEDNSVPFTVFAEDYEGDASTCSTASFSDDTKGTNFYARKHNSFLLTWDQSPDARMSASGMGLPGPANQPTSAQCKAHMRNVPDNNTPNGTTTTAVNFSGDEGSDFGTVNYIFPSMCHMGHNSNTSCGGTDNGGPYYGSMHGLDRWLELNIPGIRKDVGQDGTVVVTFDEDDNHDNTGSTQPVATWIIPGTDASGNPGVLDACGTPPCTKSNVIFSQSSTLRALLNVVGSNCALLDDSVLYQGQSLSAEDFCSAQTPLPLSHAPIRAPHTVSGQVVSAVNNTAANSISATWPSTTTAGGFLVAAVGSKGSTPEVQAPTGWTLARAQANNVAIYVCKNCAAHSGAETWQFWTDATRTVADPHVATLTIAELTDVDTGTAKDQTQGSTGSSTTASTGTTASTTGVYEFALAALSNNQKASISTPTGYTLIGQTANTGGSAGLDTGLWIKVLNGTGTQSASGTFSPTGTWWGAIATYVN